MRKKDFTLLKRHLGEPCRRVIEAGRSWGMMYDLLEELDIDRVVAQSSPKQGQLLMQRLSLMQ